MWTSQRRWTRSELDKERQEFFETRVTGRAEIWATIKAVVDLLGEGEIPTAQTMLDAAAITVPTGDLKNGAYDEAGNLYQMPEHIISDPQNLILDSPKALAAGTSMAVSEEEDEDELERRREEKGKSVIKSGDIIKVKARLSDRGGPDAVVAVGKEQPVRTLARRIQEEANVCSTSQPIYIADSLLQLSGKGKMKIAYMGKILRENESLPAQGWREGHVVNALVFP